jgi:hypothetical protein
MAAQRTPRRERDDARTGPRSGSGPSGGSGYPPGSTPPVSGYGKPDGCAALLSAGSGGKVTREAYGLGRVSGPDSASDRPDPSRQ